MASERSIFRESALKKYLQRQEQGVLLRVISPPAFVFFWIVLLLLLGTGVFAWAVQVPISITGQGVVVEDGTIGRGGQEMVVLFFPPDQRSALHQGQATTISIGSTAITLTGSIGQVEGELISPADARARFDLQGGLAQVITGPSIVVTIPLEPTASARLYIGSLCSAQVNVGSRDVLSLLPGLQQIFR
jgi:hypothetical protein